MKAKYIFGIGLAALMLTAAYSTAAQASISDHTTIFTIPTPVEIPGRVLAAGTYIFKQVDDQMNTWEIVNKRDNKVVATMFAIPDEIAKTPTKPILTLAETTRTAPEAIHSWFYPGENIGWEFLYPLASTQGHMRAHVLPGLLPSR
jgi:hypothetical protein